MLKALVLTALLSGACVSTRVLTTEELIGPRSAKFTMLRTGTAMTNDRTRGVYDFSARICDLDGSGREANCQDTLILSSVSYQPTHRWQ